MMSVDEIEEQPERNDSMCPECGEPSVDKVEHRLSALGYLHDDQVNECPNGHSWANGVPVGEFDRPEMAEELLCDSCGEGHMLVHRVRTGVTSIPTDITLDLKCPNPNCHYFKQIGRDLDEANNCALVGYPQITGKTEGADPYGYE